MLNMSLIYLMTNFVGYERCNLLQLRRSCVRRLDDEARLAARDQAPVLHRADGKTTERDHVQLGQRVPFAEICVKKLQTSFCDLLRKSYETYRFKLRNLLTTSYE